MTAPATFLGVQAGYKHLPAVELYNLTAPVGPHPAGSTVSRGTLERHGYVVTATTGQRSEVMGHGMETRNQKTQIAA